MAKHRLQPFWIASGLFSDFENSRRVPVFSRRIARTFSGTSSAVSRTDRGVPATYCPFSDIATAITSSVLGQTFRRFVHIRRVALFSFLSSTSGLVADRDHEVSASDYAEIEALVASDASPVGIDAKKTHIIISKLLQIEQRLDRLERIIADKDK